MRTNVPQTLIRQEQTGYLNFPLTLMMKAILKYRLDKESDRGDLPTKLKYRLHGNLLQLEKLI